MKYWNPYPVLEPNIALPELEIAPGLYYPSAFESGMLRQMDSGLFVVGSSIEISILSARNAVRLISKRELGLKEQMKPNSNDKSSPEL